MKLPYSAIVATATFVCFSVKHDPVISTNKSPSSGVLFVDFTSRPLITICPIESCLFEPVNVGDVIVKTNLPASFGSLLAFTTGAV